MKRRRFSFRKFALFIIVLIILVFVCFLGLYKFETSAVSGKTKAITVEVEKGDNYFTMAKKLKEKNLIKSEFFYRIFLKLHKPGKLVVGNYDLNRAMSVAEIVETLGNENNVIKTRITLTFREGLNVRQMAKIIAEKTDITEDEFFNKINDEAYVDSLKDKYWFITDDVKNPQIYYDLEGYLFPDTYVFEAQQLNLDNILTSMLNNTDKKIANLKNSIEKSGYSVHEIFTLASLVELESVTDDDRAMVAGVFYNRLNNNWSLGSDVTTYYASKKAMTEALTKAELDACNGYNTRCASMKGLPVGPIANPSLSALKAAINPTDSDYYYFVADSEKKVYFTKNANEHAKIIAELKKAGKWIG
ncbi:MAG: endolytic transglycosylase MltG [Bacilli bacterium]|nr:endolytic transglycosylase MltG [Bacilli bacterium]